MPTIASKPKKPTKAHASASPEVQPQAGRVFGYVRVSTTMQAEEGESLAVQRRQIEGYAQMQGFTLTKVYIERGISGSRPLDQRPQGSALLAALKPGDVVIAAKLDRMFRSAVNALDSMGAMKQSGISLHLIDLNGDVTGNGVSKLVFTILAAVAEAERDRIRERVSDVKRDQKQRNRYLGGRSPFGFRVTDDGALIEVPEQQAALKRIHKLRAEGLSYRVIADKLTAAGHPLSHIGVRAICRRVPGA